MGERMKISCKVKVLMLMTSCFISTQLMARDHLIYSVAEDIPMGNENEVQRRNYYVNMGQNQGVTKGVVLEVYRVISKSNPYDNKRRVNYKVPIGQLEVLHSENESAIASIKMKHDTINDPLFEINNFMIGDHVSVHIK